jgi:hypothetical protein
MKTMIEFSPLITVTFAIYLVVVLLIGAAAWWRTKISRITFSVAAVSGAG